MKANRCSLVLGWLLMFACSTAQAADAKLSLLKFERGTLYFESDEALQTLAGIKVAGLVQSTPSFRWQCTILNEALFACELDQSGEPQELPLAALIDVQIPSGRLRTLSGGFNTTLDDFFETAYPELNVVEQEADAQGRPIWILAGNMPLQSASVAEHLQFQQGDKQWKAPIEVLALDEFTGMRKFRLRFPDQYDGSHENPVLKIVQTAGLVSKPDIGLGYAREITALYPSAFDVKFGCQSGCRAEQGVELKFNSKPDAATQAAIMQQLHAQGLKPKTKSPQHAGAIRRAYGSDLSATDFSTYVWNLQGLKPSANYKLTPPNVGAANAWRGTLETLSKPASPKIIAEKTPQHLRVETTLAPHAFTILPTAVRAMPMRQVFEPFNAQFESQSGLFFGAQNLGSRLQARESVLKSSAATLPIRINRQGGTVWGALVGRSGRDFEHRQRFFTFARTEVGLHALRMRGALQAVVTDLHSSAPLADVAVELMRLPMPWHSTLAQLYSVTETPQATLPKKHIFATRKTNLLGIADFTDTPALTFDGTSEWAFRVKRSGRISVLPLLASGVDVRIAFDSDTYEEDSCAVLSHVVTEKMLYRPGEAVRFQVFLRQRIERQLRVSSVRAVKFLAQSDGNSVFEQILNLDEFGSASGEFKLPGNPSDELIELAIEEVDCAGAPAFIRVQSVDPPPIEVKLSVPEGGLLVGSPAPVATVSGQYFSGGPATGLKAGISSLLRTDGPHPLDEKFPGFKFQPELSAMTELDAQQRKTMQACENGDATQEAFMPLKPINTDGVTADTIANPQMDCEIAYIDLTADIQPPGQAAISSATLTRSLTLHDRYLGISAPEWVAFGTPISVRAIAAMAVDARVLPVVATAMLQVRRKNIWQAISQCDLDADAATNCQLEAPDTLVQQRSNKPVYRLKLSTPGFQDMFRAVHIFDWLSENATVNTNIKGPQSIAAGEVLRYRIVQPYPQAKVLLSLVSDGLLHRSWHTIKGSPAEISLIADAKWSPCFAASVFVLSSEASREPGKLPPSVSAASDTTCVEKAKIPLIQASLQPSVGKPGRELTLKLQSLSDQPLLLRLSALDAALIAFDPAVDAYRDIDRLGFLGQRYVGGTAQYFSLLALNKVQRKRVENLGYDPTLHSLVATQDRSAALEKFIANSDIKDTIFKPAEFVPSAYFVGASYTHRRSHSYELDIRSGEETLEAIIVTGSRIKRSEIESKPIHQGQPARLGSFPALGSIDALPAVWRARLRSNFAESALWQSVRLNPGEQKNIIVKLPDNLTRWRFEVLAANSSDGFQRELLEATAGLELEARALVPKQLYVGDRALFGAEIRNAVQLPRTVIAGLEWLGTGVSTERTLTMTAGQSSRLDMPAQATKPQQATVLARVQTLANLKVPEAADATAVNFNVLSTHAIETLRQDVLLPAAKPSSRAEFSIAELMSSVNSGQATLHMSASRNPMAGLLGLNDTMRDYPYRCFEQQLSRALSAAYLNEANKNLGLEYLKPALDLAWTAGALQAPHDNLAAHFNEGSALRYFASSYYGDDSLTWYSEESFRELNRLTGSAIPQTLTEAAVNSARIALERLLKSKNQIYPELEARALALMANANVQNMSDLLATHLPRIISRDTSDTPNDVLPELWLLGIAQLKSAKREALLQRVRAAGAGSKSGLRRTWNAQPGYWWGSNMRESCRVLRALVNHDASVDAKALQQQWLRGIFDQYASTQFSPNTQEIAICLGASQAYAKRWIGSASETNVAFSARFGGQIRQIENGKLNQRAPQAGVTISLAKKPESAAIEDASGSGDVVASLLITQTIDRATQPAATHGMALTRLIDVRQDGTWRRLNAGEAVRVGDWLRVRLQLRTFAPGKMIALNDPLPGGIRAVDPSLEGVADAGIVEASQQSDWFFSSNRVIEDTRVQFFGEYFPASQFEVTYISQARFAGDFVWLGATAELMYTPQVSARTKAFRLRILP